MPAPASQQEAIDAFIALANGMKHDGASVQFVSTALMRACAIYATFVVAGNEGALRESGVDKLKQIFAQELSTVQKAKMRQAGIDPNSVTEA